MSVYIFTIINALLMASVAYVFWKRSHTTLKPFYWPALLVKLVAGLLVGWLYLYYYKFGDTIGGYFHNGVILANWAKTDFLDYLDFLVTDDLPHDIWLTLKNKRIKVVVYFSKFVSVFCLITNNSYWMTALLFSVVSFILAWQLVSEIARFFPSYILPAVIAFLFFPSIVFWTSGLLKESLSIGCLFLLTALFIRFWFGKIRFTDLLLFILALLIFWKLKYYLAAIFIAVVFTSLIYKYLALKWLVNVRPKQQLLVWIAGFLVLLFMATFLQNNFHLGNIGNVIVTNYDLLHKRSQPDDVIHYNDFDNNVWSILKNVPLAFVSSLFRPFLWEAGNTFQLISALENAFILILFFFALKNVRFLITSPYRILLLSLVVYVFLLGVFIALSTPNFGTLSRFRVGYLPYFIFIVLCNNPLLKVAQRLLARLVP